MVKAYYRLAKPGIVYGNTLASVGGFFLASAGHFRLDLFLASLVGVSLVIGSACVFNNYIDRDIDVLMARTQRRPLISGEISGSAALIYGSILGIVGSLILVLFTNWLTMATALLGWFFYVVVYGYWKRHSVHGTEVGSISGAIPPVVGYVTVTGRIDLGAVMLFVILVIWQMPHFYAIAMYRREDYAAANVPVLAVSRGLEESKIHIAVYLVAFILVVPLMTYFGYTGITFAIVMTTVSGYWLYLAIKYWQTADASAWARRIFKFSLIVLVVLCLMWSIDVLLP